MPGGSVPGEKLYYLNFIRAAIKLNNYMEKHLVDETLSSALRSPFTTLPSIVHAAAPS